MNPAVKISKLNFSYPDGRPALKNISFEIEEGDRLGVVGPNGAGKTSLLFHFNGILSGNYENFEIFGLSLKEKKNLTKIRELVGLVFQNPDDQLFMPTVFEDVAFAPLQKNLTGEPLAAEVNRALGLVGLNNSYHQRMAHHLSIGEKRKVSLAAVFSQRARILVMDEPGAYLDPAGKRDLVAILEGYKKTLILASHDLHLVKKICRKILFLNDGRPVFFGPAEGFFDDENFLRVNGL